MRGMHHESIHYQAGLLLLLHKAIVAFRGDPVGLSARIAEGHI